MEKQKLTKIGIRVANILVVVMAIGVLGYYFIWKNIENKLVQRGADLAVQQIGNSVIQFGEVKLPHCKSVENNMCTESEDIILIKK